LKEKATGSFDKLVTCYQTTWFHIAEDNNIYSHLSIWNLIYLSWNSQIQDW